MLEADGNDPNLPLHSGPAPGPHELDGGFQLGAPQRRSQERVQAPRVYASWGGRDGR